MLENWAIQFDFEHELLNIWNAVINEHTGNSYIIKNAVSNQDIAPGGSVSFGFEAKSEDSITLPKNFDLLIYEGDVETSDYTVSFKVTSDWGSAFNGEFSITNNTEATIEDWILEFDFEHQIERFWTAVIEKQEGNHYYIKNAGYNANIKPGETVVLGFSGNPGNVNSEPKNYKLSQISIKPDFERDTDGDGLTDEIEKVIGTDNKKTDTDDDGLSDYFEVLNGLDPLKKDSNDNGVADNLEDFDFDKLINTDELIYNTDIHNNDTDYDGLIDGDEVNIYATDPLNPDSDDDGINDGDEVKLGLNPLSKTTHGTTLDNECIIKQKISEEKLQNINEDNAYQLSVEIDAAGNGDRLLSIEESDYTEVLEDNDAIIGKVISLQYDSFVIQNACINFELNAEQIDNNTISIYNDPGLEGIKRFQVFYYDETIGGLYPIETAYNEELGSISAETQDLGDYCLVDLEKWMYMIGIVADEPVNENQFSSLKSIEGINEQLTDSVINDVETIVPLDNKINDDEVIESEEIPSNYDEIMLKQIESVCKINDTNSLMTQQMESVYNINETNMQMMSPSEDEIIDQRNKQIELTLVIDTSGSMSKRIDYCKSSLGKMIKDLYSKGITVKVSVISFSDYTMANRIYKLSNNQEWGMTPLEASQLINQVAITGGADENHVDALITAISLQANNNTIKFAVMLTDEPLTKNDNRDKRGAEGVAKVLKERGIITSIVCSDVDINSFRPIFENTAGIQINISSDFTKYLEEFILTVTRQDLSYWVLSPTTLSPIKLKQAPIAGNTLIHSDLDGIPDSKEIDWSCTTKGTSGQLLLPTLDEYLRMKGINSFEALRRLGPSLFAKVNSIVVLPMLSNPVLIDSDFDKLNDNYDPKPLATKNNGKALASLTSSQIYYLQHWLVALGYLNMEDNPYGVAYGGLTRTAVNIYQLNHGFELTTMIDDITYDTIANEYYNKINDKDSYYAYANLSKKNYFEIFSIIEPKLSTAYKDLKIKVVKKDNSTFKSEDASLKYLYLYDYTEPVKRVLIEKQNECYKFIDSIKGENFPEIKMDYWFYSKVTNKGPWDIKRANRWKELLPGIVQYSTSFPFVLSEYTINPEILGNITYAYWGRSLGYDLDLLLVGGDIANMISDWSLEKDSPEDKKWIKTGFEYYIN